MLPSKPYLYESILREPRPLRWYASRIARFVVALIGVTAITVMWMCL